MKRKKVFKYPFFFREINFQPLFRFHGIFLEELSRHNSSTQCGKTSNSFSLKKISSNQVFSNFFSKTIVFTKFLRRKCEREFLQYPHCALFPRYYLTNYQFTEIFCLNENQCVLIWRIFSSNHLITLKLMNLQPEASLCKCLETKLFWPFNKLSLLKLRIWSQTAFFFSSSIAFPFPQS